MNDAKPSPTAARPLRVLCICGARPNFMKIAPLMHVLAERADTVPYLVHTGQHYDERMSDLFFRQLGIPEPDVNLEVGSASHAVQTARIMTAFEPVLDAQNPDWVVVVGDVNSTIACALVATKRGVKVAHVEAGLRSFDRAMPEEVNRILTDSISDVLFVTEQSGVDNLTREGVSGDKIKLVGNVMIDTLLKNRAQSEASTVRETLQLVDAEYVVATLHRPSNVDSATTLARLVDALTTVAQSRTVVLPLHPRTENSLKRFGLLDRVADNPAIRTPPPLGYLDFLHLVAHATAVVTDSGGIQEETTILNVPCVTVRENTERPVTLTHGTNRLCSPQDGDVVAALDAALRDHGQRAAAPEAPPLWDGRAAQRIVEVLTTWPG